MSIRKLTGRIDLALDYMIYNLEATAGVKSGVVGEKDSMGFAMAVGVVKDNFEKFLTVAAILVGFLGSDPGYSDCVSESELKRGCCKDGNHLTIFVKGPFASEVKEWLAVKDG